MVVAVEYISKEESAGVEAAKHGVTGILAVQGAFAEHAAMLDRLGAPWKLLRAAEDFDDSIDRVILPGGESTTQGKLLRSTGLFEPIAAHIAAGKPVFGTCAGMILLARKLDNDSNIYFGALDAVVRRNAYGRRSPPPPISALLLAIPPFWLSRANVCRGSLIPRRARVRLLRFPPIPSC